MASNHDESAPPEDDPNLRLREATVAMEAIVKDRASEKLLTLATDFGGVFTYDAEEGGLSYQPGGHADPMMKALLDISAAMPRIERTMSCCGRSGWI